MADFQHTDGEKGQSALDRYAPVKIGFLGAEFSPAYRNIHQMAFDIAKEEGWLPRNVEMIACQERGLPYKVGKVPFHQRTRVNERYCRDNPV